MQMPYQFGLHLRGSLEPAGTMVALTAAGGAPMEDKQLGRELEALKQLIKDLGEKISAAMERAQELESQLRDSPPEKPNDPLQEAGHE